MGSDYVHKRGLPLANHLALRSSSLFPRVPPVLELYPDPPNHPNRAASTGLPYIVNGDAVRSAIELCRRGMQSHRQVRIPIDILAAVVQSARSVYTLSNRPLRADLVCGVLHLLKHLLFISCDSAIDALSALGFRTPTLHCAFDSIDVLQSKHLSYGPFVAASAGQRATQATLIALGSVAHRSVPFSEPASLVALESLLTVALSAVFAHVHPQIAVHLGPRDHPHVNSAATSGVSLQVTSAPDFIAVLGFDTFAVTLDRDEFYAFIALMLCDQSVLPGIYPAAHFFRNPPLRDALLRIHRKTLILLPKRRFLALQRVADKLWNNRDFMTWMLYRQSLYGDY